MNRERMEFTVGVDGRRIILEMTGVCPVGSAQNTTISQVVECLQETAAGRKIETVLLDFRRLDYAWGDAIASIWVWALRNGVECRIRATGTTKDRLLALMENSIKVPITD